MSGETCGVEREGGPPPPPPPPIGHRLREGDREKGLFSPFPFVHFRPDAWDRGVHAGGVVDDSIIGLLALFVFPAGKLLLKYKGLGEEWAFRMHTVTALHLQYGLLSMWCTLGRQIFPRVTHDMC